MLLVEGLPLPVNPAEAEGDVEGLVIGDGRGIGVLFADPKPDPCRFGVVIFFQPLIPRVLAVEKEYRDGGQGAECRCG